MSFQLPSRLAKHRPNEIISSALEDPKSPQDYLELLAVPSPWRVFPAIVRRSIERDRPLNLVRIAIGIFFQHGKNLCLPLISTRVWIFRVDTLG